MEPDKKNRNKQNIVKKSLTASKAVFEFLNGDDELLGSEQFNARKTICESCNEFDKTGFLNTGKCNICGCSVLKLMFPKQSCPIGKW